MVFHLYIYVKVGVNVYLPGSSVWSNNYINVCVFLERHVTCLSTINHAVTSRWYFSLVGWGRMSNVWMCVWTSQEGLLAGVLCEWGHLVSTQVNPLTHMWRIMKFLIYSPKSANLMVNTNTRNLPGHMSSVNPGYKPGIQLKIIPECWR